jgi:hypothetical protein
MPFRPTKTKAWAADLRKLERWQAINNYQEGLMSINGVTLQRDEHRFFFKFKDGGFVDASIQGMLLYEILRELKKSKQRNKKRTYGKRKE